MTRLAAPLCLILILLGTLGCEPPAGKTSGPTGPAKSNLEVLGIPGPVKKLSSWSYALESLNTAHSGFHFEADFDAEVVNFTRSCGGSVGRELSVPLPSAISDAIENLFSTQELCELTYDIPPDMPVCMAMIIPLAMAELVGGENIALSRAGASICYQSITYFCEPEAQTEFIKQLEAIYAIAPGGC